MRGRSLKSRLTRLVLSSTASALLLVAIAISIHQIVAFRGALQRHVSVLADVAARNSAAPLLFQDPVGAKETLEALGADRQIVSVCLYDQTGEPFASYARDGSPDSSCPRSQADGESFSARGYALFRSVHYDDERLGSVYIESDTSQLASRLLRSAGILAVVLAAASVLSVLLSRRLQEEIAAPIRNLVEGSESLAGGDLSVAVDTHQTGELGVLASAFDGMSRSLRELIGGIRESIGAVTHATEELSSAVEGINTEARSQEEVVSQTVAAHDRMSGSIRGVHTRVEALSDEAEATARSITQLGDSTTQVATRMDGLFQSIDASVASVEEVMASVRSVAQNLEPLDEATGAVATSVEGLRAAIGKIESNADESHALAGRTAEEARSGSSAVEYALEGIKEIRASFQQIESAVGELSRESEAIHDIIEVINGVAAETGMLALNADIIAAQAGRHGRAFSVVAQEVRNLTERTTRSAQEIAQIVAKVQTRTRVAVEAVARGSESVDAGDARSAEAAGVFARISESVEVSTTMAKEIAEATQSQARGLGSVDDAMSRVRSLVVQTRTATEEQSRTSSEISRALESMRDLGRDVVRLSQAQAEDGAVIARAFDAVVAIVRQTVDATHEQMAAGEQIGEALELFQRTAEASTERAAALGAVARSLSERSGELERQIGRFRIGG